MGDLDMMEVGHFSFFNEITGNRLSHVLDVVPGWHTLNGVSELVYSCASPASVDGRCFLGILNSKESCTPTSYLHKNTEIPGLCCIKIQKLDGNFYFKFTSPSSRFFCFRRGVIRILICVALFSY